MPHLHPKRCLLPREQCRPNGVQANKAADVPKITRGAKRDWTGMWQMARACDPICVTLPGAMLRP